VSLIGMGSPGNDSHELIGRLSMLLPSRKISHRLGDPIAPTFTPLFGIMLPAFHSGMVGW
jgi:hypothetical protein